MPQITFLSNYLIVIESIKGVTRLSGIILNIPKAIGGRYVCQKLGIKHRAHIQYLNKVNLYMLISNACNGLAADAKVEQVLVIRFQHQVNGLTTSYIKALLAGVISKVPYTLLRQLVKFEGLPNDNMVLLAHLESLVDGYGKINYDDYIEYVTHHKELLISTLSQCVPGYCLETHIGASASRLNDLLTWNQVE